MVGIQVIIYIKYSWFMEVVKQIYKLRQNFILIGLTGRTGSGCSTVAKVLETENVQDLKSNYRDFNEGD
mgnify:FL=1